MGATLTVHVHAKGTLREGQEAPLANGAATTTYVGTRADLRDVAAMLRSRGDGFSRTVARTLVDACLRTVGVPG